MTTRIDKLGIAQPKFEEITGGAVVTFRVRVGETVGAELGSKVESGVGSRPETQPESQPESLDARVLWRLREGPLGKAELSVGLGQREVSGQLNKIIRVLLAQGLVEHTVPDKPNSRLQKYRLTKKGQKALRDETGQSGAQRKGPNP